MKGTEGEIEREIERERALTELDVEREKGNLFSNCIGCEELSLF